MDKTAWDPLACSLSLLGVCSATTNTKKASLTSLITNSPHSHDLHCIYNKALSDCPVDYGLFVCLIPLLDS